MLVANNMHVYHSEEQAKVVSDAYSDEEWVAKINTFANGKCTVDLFERDTGFLIARNI
jgi:hypothetical protein